MDGPDPMRKRQVGISVIERQNLDPGSEEIVADCPVDHRHVQELKAGEERVRNYPSLAQRRLQPLCVR